MINCIGIDHAAINVRDLDLSLKFYTGILGLKPSKREHPKPGQEIFLDCGTSLIGLIQAKNLNKEHLLQDKGFGGNHVSFRVNTHEFDRSVAELEKADVTIYFTKKRDKSWSVYFQDPDGNKLEITAWPEEDR